MGNHPALSISGDTMDRYAAYPSPIDPNDCRHSQYAAIWALTKNPEVILAHPDAIFLDAPDLQEALSELEVRLGAIVNADLPPGLTRIGGTYGVLKRVWAESLEAAFHNATETGISLANRIIKPEDVPAEYHAIYKGTDVTDQHNTYATIVPFADDRAYDRNTAMVRLIKHGDWLRKCAQIKRACGGAAALTRHNWVSNLSPRLYNCLRAEFRKFGGMGWQAYFTRWDNTDKKYQRLDHYERIISYIAMARTFRFGQAWWDGVPSDSAGTQEVSLANILIVAAKPHRTNVRFNEAIQYLLLRLRKGKWRNELKALKKKPPTDASTVPTSKS